jgi:hypothetical protein
MPPIQDHLFSIYLPFDSTPLFERMIDGRLWQLIQLDLMFWGMAGIAFTMQAWETYRLNVGGCKNES